MRHADETREKSRNTRRRLILILSLSAVFIMVSIYCLQYYMTSTERIVLKHLSEKYDGQEFIPLGISNTGYFGRGEDVLHCYPKGGDPKTDDVDAGMLKTEDGEVEFNDNYFGILIREDVEAEVLDTLSDMNLPMKAYYREFGSFDEIFDGTKTYADLKKAIIAGEENHRFDIDIYLLCENIENREQYAEQIFDKLSEDGLRRLVDVYVTADTNLYNRVTRRNQDEIFIPDDETVFSFYKIIG